MEALIEFVNKLNKDDLKVSAINILRKLIGNIYQIHRIRKLKLGNKILNGVDQWEIHG